MTDDAQENEGSLVARASDAVALPVEPVWENRTREFERWQSPASIYRYQLPATHTADIEDLRYELELRDWEVETVDDRQLVLRHERFIASEGLLGKTEVTDAKSIVPRADPAEENRKVPWSLLAAVSWGGLLLWVSETGFPVLAGVLATATFLATMVLVIKNLRRGEGGPARLELSRGSEGWEAVLALEHSGYKHAERVEDGALRDLSRFALPVGEIDG